MLLRWNELSLLSCPAYIVHVSLPFSNVLITQALQTVIFGTCGVHMFAPQKKGRVARIDSVVISW